MPDIKFNMQLFYLPDLSKKQKVADFSKEESKHIYKVLRKKIGDDLQITNGKNTLFKGTISTISKSNCSVTLKQVIEKKSLPYSLHIGISLLKSNERFEWFLEKASEIGITEITPLICNRTEKKFINENRFKKILVSSMKQSLKTHLPKLNSVSNLRDFIEIKPEGDFTNEEVKKCNNKKFQNVSLGDTRLRAETAGIVACHTISIANM